MSNNDEHLPPAEWLQADRDDEIADILAEQWRREGPPSEFDPRGCRAVLALVAATWIVMAAIIVGVI